MQEHKTSLPLSQTTGSIGAGLPDQKALPLIEMQCARKGSRTSRGLHWETPVEAENQERGKLTTATTAVITERGWE